MSGRDDRGRPVNLLLLLSALLSALTGVGGTRGAAAPQTVCAQSVEVSAVRIAAAVAGTRPVQALPALAMVRRATGAALMLAAGEPLFASRRRE
jgi:hypothetical protein